MIALLDHILVSASAEHGEPQSRRTKRSPGGQREGTGHRRERRWGEITSQILSCIPVSLSWYDLAIPRLGTTYVLRALRHMESVPGGNCNVLMASVP